MEKKRSLSLMQKMTLWFILIILLPSCVLSVVLCRALTDRAYDILVEDHYAVLASRGRASAAAPPAWKAWWKCCR